MLSPPQECCQICAVKHDPGQPHNAQSFYYQMAFYTDHGRWPTWKDAMEHCTEDVRENWTTQLVALGVDVEGGQLRPTTQTQEVKD